MSDPAAIAAIITLLLTICAGIGRMAWWLSGRFIDLKEDLQTKLDVHKADVSGKFDLVNNRLLHIELRNASVDGRTTLVGGIELP